MLESSSKKMRTALLLLMVAARQSLRLNPNPIKTDNNARLSIFILDLSIDLLLQTVGKISTAQMLAPFPSLRLNHSF